jgi:hypothetical protein
MVHMAHSLVEAPDTSSQSGMAAYGSSTLIFAVWASHCPLGLFTINSNDTAVFLPSSLLCLLVCLPQLLGDYFQPVYYQSPFGLVTRSKTL